MRYRLVLASQSPRRREILERAGFRFEVRAVGIPEKPDIGESPVEYVRRLARAKAEAVKRSPEEIVLGADTIVVAGDELLEKPSNLSDAERMLRLLSGREHSVITGIYLCCDAGSVSDHAETRVRFLPLSDREIADYAASEEPADKAGAYAIQGFASKFIDRIEGCYFNVVGLPVSLVYRRLLEFGNQTGPDRW